MCIYEHKLRYKYVPGTDTDMYSVPVLSLKWSTRACSQYIDQKTCNPSTWSSFELMLMFDSIAIEKTNGLEKMKNELMRVDRI
jgi:hypothetical protein